MSSPTRPQARLGLAAGAGLVALLAFIYLIPASSLGFWEPWETTLATLGRFVATTDGVSPFAPIRDDALVSRPWLQTWLLSLGYQVGGGSELGFRVPLAVMMILASLTGFVVLRRFFGTLRAFCATALFGVSPVVLLASTNLAGHAAYEATVVVTFMLFAAIVGGWDRARPIATVLLGPALALCLWAGGILGLAVPLAAMALYCVGARDAEQPQVSIPAAAIGGLVAAIAVLWPLLTIWGHGTEALAQAVALALEADPEFVAEPTTVSAIFGAGWDAGKDLLGVGVGILAPIGLLIAALPGSRARKMAHPLYLAAAAALFAVMVVPPFLTLLAQTTALVADTEASAFDAALSALLYNDFLSGRVLPEHVTYDVLVRLVGASAFPTVMLVPFGFAYLFRTFEAPDEETDDTDAGARAVKQLFTIWMVVGFLVFGLGASLAGTYTFPIAFPMTAAAALALGDRRFRAALTRSRLVLYVGGLSAMLLLAMTSKDIRGTFNEEMGRPGPHVIFERLLTDGSVEFPHTYALEHISLFMLAWALIIVLGFAEPIRNLAGLGEAMRGPSPKERDAAGGRLAKARTGLQYNIAKVGGVIERVAAVLTGHWKNLSRGVSTATLALVAFTGVTVAWAAHLAYVDIPNVTDHLSQKGIMDTFDELSGGQGALYVAGINENDNSYYLQEGPVEPVARVTDLRDLFCEADGRVFAVIPFDKLAEAHYAVRSAQDGDEPCDAPQPFHVVDGRSSRYVLLSNELHEDAGETEQSVIAANVFTPETLPDTVRPPESEIIVDGRLRLAGYELPETTGSGEFTVAAYWEVLERPNASHEIFIHVDRGGNRLNGDHEPVRGYYPMRYWVPGEIVRDAHEIEVSRADRKGTYHVYYGFFRGDDRLSIEGGEPDNRFLLGTLEVE